MTAEGTSERKRDLDWINREKARSSEPGYIRPVWKDETFWLDRSYNIFHHFTHVSTVDPSVIAFTENANKGELDIQTRMRAGRYLTRYFGDVLTPKQIKGYAEWQTTGDRTDSFHGSNFTLKFAKTPDEFEKVYRYGPDSCMRKMHFIGPNNPVRVYAAGDLELAYLVGSDPHKIYARALIYRENSAIGRVYPTIENWFNDAPRLWESETECHDAHMALLNRLRRMGLDQGNRLDGARMLKMRRSGNCWTMPYLDQSYQFDEDGDFFVLGKRGDYSCDETCGYMQIDRTNDDMRSDNSEYENWCDRCDSGCDELTSVITRVNETGEGRNSQTWCESCVENHASRCDGLQELVSDGVPRVSDGVGDGTYVLAWALANGFFVSAVDYMAYKAEDDGCVVLDAHDTDQNSKPLCCTTEQFESEGFTCPITAKRGLAPICSPSAGSKLKFAFDVHPDAIAVWLDTADADIEQQLSLENV